MSRVAAFVCAVLAAATGLAVAACGAGTDATTSVAAPVELSISAPSQVGTNDELTLTVEGTKAGVPVEVTVDGGYGPRRVTVTPTSNSVEVLVPPGDRPESGLVLVTAAQPGRVGVSTLEMTPGEPVDPLDLYLGPRTVVADTEHFTMIVAVPEDDRGNPVSNDYPVDYKVTRPNGVVEQETHPTSDLLSHFIVFSRTVTGRTRIGVEAGEAGGPERNFLEVAGVPAPFDLEVEGEIAPADGQALTVLRTAVLTDEFGNELPDGVVVYLDIEGVTGTRRLYSATIDAVAEFQIESPTEPGSATAVGVASGIVGNPLPIRFPAAVETVPVEVRDHVDGLEVVVGPVRTVRNAYVPDGTLAVVSVDGTDYEVPLELGVGSVVVPAPDNQTSLRASVDVLGVTGVVR
jgi:hypothetical protein